MAVNPGNTRKHHPHPPRPGRTPLPRQVQALTERGHALSRESCPETNARTVRPGPRSGSWPRCARRPPTWRTTQTEQRHLHLSQAVHGPPARRPPGNPRLSSSRAELAERRSELSGAHTPGSSRTAPAHKPCARSVTHERAYVKSLAVTLRYKMRCRIRLYEIKAACGGWRVSGFGGPTVSTTLRVALRAVLGRGPVGPVYRAVPVVLIPMGVRDARLALMVA